MTRDRLALTAIAAAVLGPLAARHPDLRLVDLIRFSDRAQHLGDRLVDPLDPVGYAALLAVGHALVGDVLVAGKALAVAAGIVTALAAAALFEDAVVGLWVLAQAGVMAWGITEGADLPAAGLCLAAIAAASRRRSALAGTLLGAACLLRSSALAAAPAVLLLDRRAWKGLAVAAGIHLGLAAWAGGSPLPGPWEDLGIGSGPAFIARWPAGFVRALLDAVPDGPTAVGAVGLVLGLRDRRARALLASGLAHAAFVAFAFSNARLCLPTTLAFSCGVAGWLPVARRGVRIVRDAAADLAARDAGSSAPATAPPDARWDRAPTAALAVAAVALAAWNARALWRPDEQEQALAALASATTPVQGTLLSNSTWFHVRRDGWLVGAKLLDTLGDPPLLTPQTLAAQMRETGAGVVALDLVRVPRALPRLVGMMKDTPPEFELLAETRTWRAFVLSDPGASPAADRDSSGE